MANGCDTDFRDAVLAAATGWKRGDDLAEMLRSDRPLGEGERELLAMLVEGSLNRKRGKRSEYSAALRNWIALFYIERLEACEKSDSIAADLKDLFGVERGNLLGWVREITAFEDNHPEYAERYREDIKRTGASDNFTR